MMKNARLPIFHESDGSKDWDKPTIQFFTPDQPNGTSLLIFPGGGYHCLCDTYEGDEIAEWANRFGITCAVLRYRLAPVNHYPDQFNDARQGMLLARRYAIQHGLDSHRVGIIGFSAGGHLASTLATHFQNGGYAGDDLSKISSRPDFQILVYPVISLTEDTHGGTRDNFLGVGSCWDNEAMALRYSSDRQVHQDCPPAFIVHSVKDQSVPVSNSRRYVAALRNCKVPVEYLELPAGAHGLGGTGSPEWNTWQAACLKWLRNQKLAD